MPTFRKHEFNKLANAKLEPTTKTRKVALSGKWLALKRAFVVECY